MQPFVFVAVRCLFHLSTAFHLIMNSPTSRGAAVFVFDHGFLLTARNVSPSSPTDRNHMDKTGFYFESYEWTLLVYGYGRGHTFTLRAPPRARNHI